jgi:excisionase family DNA binding protein
MRHTVDRVLDGDPLLTREEVAVLFRVDPRTVTRWAKASRIASVKTPGGRRLYRQSVVQAALGR